MCAACGVVCWREPLHPLPCIELTIFCFIFRLHPPSFLFVLALDSPPWGFDPPPHRFSFQLSTTMALAPASPLPAGKRVPRVPSLRVCVCVQGLPCEGGRIGSLLPSPPQSSAPCAGGGTAGRSLHTAHPRCLCPALRLSPSGCGSVRTRSASPTPLLQPPEPRVSAQLSRPRCTAGPSPSAAAHPLARLSLSTTFGSQ